MANQYQIVMEQSAILELLTHITTALTEHTLNKINFSKYRGQDSSLQRIIMRPIIIKQQPYLSCTYEYPTQTKTRNIAITNTGNSVAELLEQYLNEGFQSVYVVTQQLELQLLLNKRGRAQLIYPSFSSNRPVASTIELTHNREKVRYLSIDEPFLTALGVTTSEGQLVPMMARKWKQINKFIEILGQAIDKTPLNQASTINVADFGSGKGYLTFAMYAYIRQHLGIIPQITGVELRKDLVSLCNDTAQSLQWDQLTFYQGDIQHFSPKALDVMVALHACDVATDYALFNGIRLGASIILCAPCCHKEVRPQILMPPVLKSMLQHGVHLGQEAEMLTDSLRALLLAAYGYETKIFEFVALEHTQKNKMILAVKKTVSPQEKAKVLAQVSELKNFYGIKTQQLEQLLQNFDDSKSYNAF